MDTNVVLLWCIFFASVCSMASESGITTTLCEGSPRNPDVTCGDTKRIGSLDAVLALNDNCMVKFDGNAACQRNVSLLLQLTCGDANDCYISWDALKCLNISCDGKFTQVIHWNYTCTEGHEVGDVIETHVGNCSDWVYPATTQTPSTASSSQEPTHQSSSTSVAVPFSSSITQQDTTESELSTVSTNLSFETATTWNTSSTSMNTIDGGTDKGASVTTGRAITKSYNDESLTKKNLIIYAAAGGAGFLLVILIIILLCCCIKRKNQKEKTSATSKDSTNIENGVQMAPVSDNGEVHTSPDDDNCAPSDRTHDMYAPVDKSQSLKKPSTKKVQPDDNEANYVYSSSDKPVVPPKMPGIESDPTRSSMNTGDEAVKKTNDDDETYESVENSQNIGLTVPSVAENQYDAALMPKDGENLYDATLMPKDSENQNDAASMPKDAENLYDATLISKDSENQYDATLMPKVSENQYDATLISSEGTTPPSSGDSDTLQVHIPDYAPAYAKTSGDDIVSKLSIRDRKLDSNGMAKDDVEYDYAEMPLRDGSLMHKASFKNKEVVDEDYSVTASDDYSDVEMQNDSNEKTTEVGKEAKKDILDETNPEHVDGAKNPGFGPSDPVETINKRDATEPPHDETTMVENDVYDAN